MSDTRTGKVEIRGTPAEVWTFLWDADALGRVLPGCESIRELEAGRYAAVLAFRTTFLTVRADTTAEVREPVEARSAVLALDGTARGLGGGFHVLIHLTLEPADATGAARTDVGYVVEAQVTGALAGLGARMLRDAVVGEVEGLARDIEREIDSGRVPTSTE